MDIIKVNSSKMKIILTDTDFKQMGVDALSFDYTDEKSKDVLKKILKLAGQRYDFDIISAKLLIEYFPCKKGGGEIYISKLENNEKDNTNLYISAFSQNLENIISICKNFKETNLKSRLYSINSGYLLLLKLQNNHKQKSIPGEFLWMSDFAKVKVCTDLSKTYLDEYALCICSEKAIETFKCFFDKTH